MSNVEPEEVEALLGPSDTEAKERVVDPRDFRSPRRLSGGQREQLSAVLGAVLGDIEAHLATLLESEVKVELGSIGEVNATDLFLQEDELPCVLAFRLGGAPAWVLWESAAAVSAVEALLGCGGDGAEARRLSKLETGVLVDVLRPVAERLVSPLGATGEGFEVVQVQQDLELAAARAAESDPHRLEIELAVRLGESSSSLRCYLPGIGAAAVPSAGENAEGLVLPPTANAVPVDLHVRLTGCDVPLSQLLSLAPGDVIPLEDRTDEPLTLFVGETRYGTAYLGTRNGRLALRLEQIG